MMKESYRKNPWTCKSAHGDIEKMSKPSKKKPFRGLQVPSLFGAGAKDPYKLLKWKARDCQIADANGQVYFAQKNVQAPESWSQLAVDIAASKYFRKAGVPRTVSETSVQQMISRVIKKISKEGRRQGYFSPSAAQAFEVELALILLHQRAFFNSPVWFNCGLFEAYKIEGESNQWRWNEKNKAVEVSLTAFRYPQVSACFIQSVEDNLESIFELAKTEARLFKYGSGSGTNFSTLRSRYESLEGGGTSSGLMSFLDVFDRGAGSIKSGGVTRRAAKMVCVDVDHPEIQEFIAWKAREEKKAQALVAAGYGGEFDGEAYRTVSGQNANNSVRVTDEFMRAVAEDGVWPLVARTTKKVLKKIPAKQLWDEIVSAAWACADPGLQFHDTIQKWHTCPRSGAIRASNPCSEYMFLDNSACNLASLNLLRFLREDASFDFIGFMHTARVMLIAQEILIDSAGYPTAQIAQNSHDYRPLGLGFAGLGALLMQKAIPYDSDEARAWAAGLTALLTGVAYRTSAELAQVKGPFSGFKKNRQAMLRVVGLHQQELKNIKWKFLPEEFSGLCRNEWLLAIEKGKKTGYRNSQVTAIAPTGTIGLVMDAETTGVEPEFSLVKIKKLSGGGEMRLVSQSFAKGLRYLNYSEEQIQDLLLFVERYGSARGGPHLKPDHQKIFQCAMELSSEAHVLMMAAIQPFVSGAISKTINLPQICKPQDVAHVYWRAWELGLKSIAVYRDRSKSAQPLAAQGEWSGGPPECVDCG